MVTIGELCDAAQALGVSVQWVDLGPKLLGEYRDDCRQINLHRQLCGDTEVSVMAHECGHAVVRDKPTRNKREHGRQERMADAYAARRLISPVEYAIAERIVGPDPKLLAEELGVCDWVIRAFQREAGYGRAWTGVRSA